MKNCKKHVKKLLCFIMLSTLVIAISQPVFSYAENGQEEEPKKEGELQNQNKKDTQYDVTKPVIEKVEFLQQGQTLKEGDTIRLHVYAYDVDSGIERVNVHGTGFYEEGTYDEEKGCYILEHTLENVDGNFLTIDDITVTDRYGNYTTWPTVDPEDGSYIFWANVEWQKPEVVEVQVHIKDFEFNQNGQEINENTLMELTLETEEILDGDHVFACFEHDEWGSEWGSLAIPLQCSDASGQLFKNTGYQIDELSLCARDGKWILSNLYIKKESGKRIELRPDNLELKSYYYTFKKGNEEKADREAPVITDVKLEKNGETLRTGDSAHITVYATDNVGLAQGCFVDFSATSDFWGDSQTVELSYDEHVGRYEGDFVVTDETYPCEWYISHISVRDTSRNLADDDRYTDSAEFPYYINVVNGSTLVLPTYDLYIDFQALDESGNWETIEQIHKEGIERRQTLQGAGIIFPEMNSKYPGFNQIGWTDSEGNEITGDTQCMYSGTMTVHAKYDKRNIDVDCKFIADNAGVFYGFHNIVIPHDATFADLKKELEKIVPKSTFSGLTFQGWKLESFDGHNMDNGYKDSDLLPKSVGPFAFATAKAMYGDWNILNTVYTYPNVNNGYSIKNHPVIYKKGNKYDAVIAMLQDYEPEDISKEYEFEKWEYDINKTEDTVTDDSDHLIDVNCTAKFKGKSMLQILQWFYNKNGMFGESQKVLFVDDGTKFDEVKEELESWEAPEYCKGTTFKSWDITRFAVGVGASKALKNGEMIQMSAIYDGTPDTSLSPGIVEKPGTNPPGGTDTEEEGTKQPGEYKPGEQQGIQLPDEKISQVVDIVNKAESGTTIQVDMADATVIPKEILEAAKGKNNEIILNMGDYSWTVNGTDIAATDLKSIDLKVVMDTDNIPSKTIQDLAGNNPVQQISLVHQGDFGFKATLTVNMGKEHAGQFGNLYYHDSDKKLVFIDAGVVEPGGNVSLTFSHASDYMIVVSDQKMSQANVPNEFAPDQKPGGNQVGGDKIQTGGSSQTGNGNKTQAGNDNSSQSRPQSEVGTENSDLTVQDSSLPRTETSSQIQAASNSPNEVQNKSVQTGDETKAILYVLTSILSLGIIILLWKAKKTY